MTETPLFQYHAFQSLDGIGLHRRVFKGVNYGTIAQQVPFPERYSPLPFADADVPPLSEIMHRLELASAEIHNVRIVSRNAHNINLDGTLEAPEKTIEGHGAALALVIKGRDMEVSIPSNPARIRDRPKNFNPTGRIEDCTSQDILDLIVFYNDDFGIVREDKEEVWRGKLRRFLTQQRMPKSSTGLGGD